MSNPNKEIQFDGKIKGKINELTSEALDDVEKKRNLSKTFDNIEALMEALNAED